MSYGKRAGVLVGLLVASLVAGGFAGVASAGQASASPADSPAVDTDSSDAFTFQSGENDTQSGENTTIHYEGEGMTLAPSAGETITGETDLAPGTALTIKVVSEDDQAPLLKSTDVTVAENGSFVGTVDLSNAQTNLPVTVYVEKNHRKIAKADGTIVRCTENCSGPEEWPEFSQGIFQAPHGEKIDVSVVVPPGTDGPVNLTLGDEDSNFLVETKVADADGDGEITVTLDAGAAGNGSPNEYLSAGDDRIESAQQRTEDIEPPLDAGHYRLEVGPREAPYDIATLAIQEASGENDAEEREPGVETTGEVTFITAGDTLEVGNVERQAVRAETELEPGTTVDLQLKSTDPSNPFLLTDSANVTEYGTLNFSVDMNDVEAGAYFEAVARHDGEAVGAAVGEVIECDGECSTVDSSVERPASAENSSEDSQEESNVVEVDDEQAGGIPLTGLAAIGVGGLLALFGLAYFTGLLKR